MGNSSRLKSRDGSALFAWGIADQTLRLLLTNFVRLNPPLAQSSINFSSSVIAFSSVGTGFKRSSAYKLCPRVSIAEGSKLSSLSSAVLIRIELAEQGESVAPNMCTVIAYSWGTSSVLPLHHRNLLNLGLLDRLSPDRTYSQCPQPGLHSLCEISTRPQLNCLCNQGPAAGSYSRMCSRVLRQHQRLSRLYLACCCWSLQNWEDTRFWDRISKLLHLTVYRRIPLLCNPPW